jgi:hypothetical protein
MLRKCSQCKELKPSTVFYKNKTRKEGLQTMCRDCSKQNSKKQYSEDRKKRIEYVANWAKNNPEKRREYRREYEKSRKYKEYKREYMRRYMKNYRLREEYREHRRQYMREYYQKKKREEIRNLG